MSAFQRIRLLIALLAMESPATAIMSLNVANDHTVASRERRKRLPTLTTKLLFETGDHDYSRFALSPLTSHALLRGHGGGWTPVTAVPIKSPGLKSPLLRSPTVCTPSTPLRTAVLQRYLTDASSPDGSDLPPFDGSLTLAGAGITDALPTPGVIVPWSLIMGSPPETNSDCFSPVLGTGPAEQDFSEPRSPFSNKSDGEPKSAHSAKSLQSAKSLPAGTLEWLLDVGDPETTDNTTKPREVNGGKDGTKAQSKPQNLTVNSQIQGSPTETENTFIEEDFGAAEAPWVPTLSVPKTVWNRRKSFPQFLRKTKKAPKVSITFLADDKDDVDHPHPLRSAPIEEAPSRTKTPTLAVDKHQEKQAGLMDPPPAPTALSFADQLPRVKICIEPSPFSPPPAPTSGSFPVTLLDTVASIDPSPFDPPPAPTVPRFKEEFPASPIHAGPCPIDTTIPFVQWRSSQEPSSAIDSPVLPEARLDKIMASINPPPAPTQARFFGLFPETPNNTKSAPIGSDAAQVGITGESNTTPKALPPPPKTALLDKILHSSNAGNSLSSTTEGTQAVKTAKMVRFAVVDSPSGKTHFKSPLSPSPWSPEAFYDGRFASILSPIDCEPDRFTVPPPETTELSMTNALLDGTMPRGRSGQQKLKRLGRLTRSISPKRTRDEAMDITVLPNTVYDPETKRLYTSNSPVISDKYIILQTYFNPNRPISEGESGLA